MKVGEHIRCTRVKGSTYQVMSVDGKYLEVRCLSTGVPARVRRDQLDRWKVVWTPLSGPGMEGLVENGRMLTRSDAPKPRVSLK
jgi:hypothetical protein